MSAPSLAIGQKIELNDGRVALVRFLGTTNFQTGEWIGVELTEPTGKNDGSVKGDRYFECEPGYGMFLRASGVRQILERPKPKAAVNGTVGKRLGGVPATDRVNGLKRQSVVDTRRTSTIGGATSSVGSRAGVSGVRGSMNSPTKSVASSGVSSSAASRAATPSANRRPLSTSATSKPRQSLLGLGAVPGKRLLGSTTASGAEIQQGIRAPGAPVVTPGSRASLGGSNAATRTPASRSANAVAARQQRLSATTEDETDETQSQASRLSASQAEEELSSVASQQSVDKDQEDQEDQDETITSFAPPPIPPDPPKSPPGMRSRRPSSTTAASAHSQRTIRSTTASNKQIEELEAKLRLLERKRQEDRELKQLMEQAQQERDHYKGIIEKLQSKYRPQQQELAQMKQALNDAEKKYADLEAVQTENDGVLEMATLDREMAEELAEGLKAELEAIRAHSEEVQLELDILREENSELTKEVSPEERESAGWTQLQLSNDRLRNALLALRDRSMDEKEELGERIRGLEDQIKDSEAIKKHYEGTREKLLRSEADISDLRQQLELAQQADEIIEQMTDTNGRLEGHVADLRATVADLEDLRELNDELEINHIEAEKQMQEEIDFKESLLLDRDRMARQQQEALDDADHTISQFRQLVRQLQADLDDMRASKQISETEAKELEGKSRAMIDLNMKLQSTASRTQVKTIDLELRKLEAEQAKEHLTIVMLFMPETFNTERDSVLALLRFKRIAFKANLVHNLVKERIASFGTRGQDEETFAACVVSDKLTWIACMAERFVNSIFTCSVEDFVKYESALYELEPVERALNSYVEKLRGDELNERDMAEELQRSIAVMSHLSSLHIGRDIAGHMDELLMRTMCLQANLETSATALQMIRALVDKNIKASANEDEDEEGSASDLTIIVNRADALTNNVRSAKVMAGKLHRSLQDLQIRSLALDPGFTEELESTETMMKQISTFILQAGEGLRELFTDESHADTFSPSEVSSIFSRVSSTAFSLPVPEAGPLTALAARLRDFTDALVEFASLPTDLDNTVEFEKQEAPWVARANELKVTKTTSVDTETELARAIETLRDREVVIHEKETELEEQSVRIEMLEARMRDASKRSARIAELEKELHRVQEEERRWKRQIESVKADKERAVEQIRAEIGRHAEGNAKDRRSNGDVDPNAMNTVARVTLEHYQQKIASLESAIRWLSSENYKLRLPAPDAPLAVQHSLAWLQEPLQPKRTMHQIHRENVHKAGSDALLDLLHLAARTPTVDLTSLPADNRLAWRPRKEDSRWKVEAGKEEWQRLKDRRAHIVQRALSRELGQA